MGTWADALVVMIFSLTASYELLLLLGVPRETAWLLGFAVDVALAIALFGDQQLAEHNVTSSRGYVLRWVSLAMSLALNTGVSFHIAGDDAATTPIDWVSVAAHSFAPLLLLFLTEYAQDVQLKLGELIRDLEVIETAERQSAQEIADRRRREEQEAVDRRRLQFMEAERLAAEARAAEARAAAEERRQIAESEAVLLRAQTAAQTAELTARATADRAAGEKAEALARAALDEQRARERADRQKGGPGRSGGRLGRQSDGRSGDRHGQRSDGSQTVSAEAVLKAALDYAAENTGALPTPAKLRKLTGCSESTSTRALRFARKQMDDDQAAQSESGIHLVHNTVSAGT